MGSGAPQLAAAEISERQFLAISKALADKRRFEILRKIAGCEGIGCGDLMSCTQITPATRSHHLKQLEQAGLITLEREGKFLHPRLCRDVWAAYLVELQKL
jgi:ArsR family transcriptional regulator